jgi:hypothetical protein
LLYRRVRTPIFDVDIGRVVAKMLRDKTGVSREIPGVFANVGKPPIVPAMIEEEDLWTRAHTVPPLRDMPND